jgi:DNA-binding NarL/FixJ family response regulator
MRKRVVPPLAATPFVEDGEEFILLSYPVARPRSWDRLSDAERAVAEALLEGQSNAEIAAARGVAVRTIANQVASIFRKLGVRSRTELAARP